MEISKEQFDELKKIEKHLHTAYYYNFLSGVKSDDLTIAGVLWQQIYGKYEALNFRCSSCTMNVFYKLGRLYFNSIDKFNVVVEKKKEEIQLDDNQLVEDNKEVNDLIELIDDEIQMAHFDIAAELMKEPINEQKNIFENGERNTWNTKRDSGSNKKESGKKETKGNTKGRK